jgi:hypothetical protein
MIMPSKYLREDEALIGVCAALLPCIDKNRSLSALWEDAKTTLEMINFERFVLALDLLYLLGVVEIHKNEIVKVEL